MAELEHCTDSVDNADQLCHVPRQTPKWYLFLLLPLDLFF